MSTKWHVMLFIHSFVHSLIHSSMYVYDYTARPDTNILVTEEIVNGTHYQAVSCSAANGRPMAQISWLIDDSPPTDDYFTVDWSSTSHPNGTATMSSTLRFPTYLQDGDRVTCEVQHPTLPNPTLTAVRVDTYGKQAHTFIDKWDGSVVF